MSTLTFRGSFVRYADLRMADEGAVFARLHMTSLLTNPVAEAMEWETVPDCVDSAKLEGTLSSQKLVLTPNRKELRDFEIEIECSEVSDFQLARVQEKDGESKRTELRFIARVAQEGAIQWIENYLRKVGRAEGALKLSYVKQDNLPLEEDEKLTTKEQREDVSASKD